MRHLVGVYLKAGCLFRRYLQFPLCRQMRVLDQLTPRGSQHQYKHHCVSGSLYRRGLTLGWAYAASEPSLLDVPHTKTYRLAFDGRLYQSKSRSQLEARAQLPFKALVGQQLGGWGAGLFSNELGMWGEKTGHPFRPWVSCDRLTLRVLSGAMGRGRAAWACQQPWGQLTWGWALSSWLGAESVMAPLLWSEALWRAPHIETDEAHADWVEGAGILEGSDFVSFLAAHAIEVADAGLRVASDVRVPVIFAPAIGPLAEREATAGIWLFYLESAGVSATGASVAQGLSTQLAFRVTLGLHVGALTLIV